MTYQKAVIEPKCLCCRPNSYATSDAAGIELLFLANEAQGLVTTE